MALSKKHLAFVDMYLELWNQTEAYLRVYPNSSKDAARANAARLIANDSIAAEIARRVAERSMSADEALLLLADQARADLGGYITDAGEIDIAAMKAAGATKLLRKVKRTVRRGTSKDGGEWENETLEVDLLNPQTALDLIVKAHGLLKQQIDHTVHGSLDVTGDEIAQARQRAQLFEQKLLAGDVDV